MAARTGRSARLIASDPNTELYGTSRLGSAPTAKLIVWPSVLILKTVIGNPRAADHLAISTGTAAEGELNAHDP
jgi:hypothetical protein